MLDDGVFLSESVGSSSVFGVLGLQSEPREIPSFIEGTQAHLAAGERAVDRRKPWLFLLVHKNLDGACANVADDANIVPGTIRQRRCRF